MVLLYHAELGILGAGYLGVDIFFVISGFLITGIVKRSIEQNDFSFRKFYFRRAKRLLPAAYVTFFVTTLLAPFFLTSQALDDFTFQLAGAITYSANIFLWLQSGYFQGAAELKPLLHIWSLSIEEQYYLLLPAALVLSPRRYWIWGGLLVTLFSFALCLAFVSSKPDATFYLLPTRAWEMSLGSIGALACVNDKHRRIFSYFSIPAIFTLIVIPVYPIGTSHPGLDAILVCSATFIVLISRPAILNENKLVTALSKVGDISYSLYLAHWPVFAFAQNAYLSDIPLVYRLLLVILSLVLGYGLFWFVERPTRRLEVEFSVKLVILAVLVSIGLLSIPLASSFVRPSQEELQYLTRPNFGFGKECEFEEHFSPKTECRNSNAPAMMVWGDSYAMHLIPGIVASTDKGVIQATRSVCGPILGMAPFSYGRNNKQWAKECIEFNNSVFKYLETEKSIEVVVLSSPFRNYLGIQHSRPPFQVLRKVGEGYEEIDGNVALAVHAMNSTIAKLREIGKRVVVVAPPPRGDFDIGKCIERMYSGLTILGGKRGCRILISEYHGKQQLVFEFLDNLALIAKVRIVRFDELMCSSGFCETIIEEVFIYRDKGHFSYSGSKFVGRKLGLGEMLIDVSR